MDGTPVGQPQRALVVDDEHMQLIIQSRMLAAIGFEADCAQSLAEARSHLERQRYDVLLLDLSLRDEDSLSLLHAAVQIGQAPRVMFISGMDRRVRAAAARVAQGLRLPIAGTLSKPVERKELVRLLAATAPARAGPDQATRVPPTPQQLAAALDAGDIFPLYQPKVSLATGALVGVEALARWTSVEHGIVPPDVFIPMAEAHGLIGRVTEAIMTQALAGCARLRAGGAWCSVAVNLSAACLHDPGLTEWIDEALRASQLPPGALTIELTESCAVGDAAAAEILTRLRIRGFELSIDDFGTGHSSLLSLLRLPFSELKIDKSFVLACLEDPEAQKIVRATVALARELGLRTVAEGIETQPLADALQRFGCEVGQGWLFGRPTEVELLLTRFGAASRGPDGQAGAPAVEPDPRQVVPAS